MSAVDPTTPNFFNTMVGAPVIGVGFNLILYGITVMQVYQYYLDCKKDAKWIKYLIAFIFIADSLNSSFNFALLYTILQQAYMIALQIGNGEIPAKIMWWTGVADPAVTSVISGAVQLFFAWRIYRLTLNRFITVVVATFAILQTLAGCGLAICLSKVLGNDKPESVNVGTQVWLGLALVTDSLITGTLVLHLRSLKTGRAATDDMITRIMRTTVQTGAITTVWVCINLILYSVEKNNLNTIFNFPLCKIYTNTILSSLNARSRWRSPEEAHLEKPPSSFSVPWSKSRDGTTSGRQVQTNTSEIVFADVGQSSATTTIPRTDQYQIELESVKSREMAGSVDKQVELEELPRKSETRKEAWV